MTDPTTHQQESAVLISTSCDKAADGSYTATVSVSGLASEEQAKGDVRRMREALSAPEIQQALPELPDTPYDLHYEWPDDEDGFGGSEVIGDNGYTADQMRAYAADAVRAASAACSATCAL